MEFEPGDLLAWNDITEIKENDLFCIFLKHEDNHRFWGLIFRHDLCLCPKTMLYSFHKHKWKKIS